MGLMDEIKDPSLAEKPIDETDEAVDMDEESKDTTDSDLDDEADAEPDTTLGEDDDIEEVEGEDDVEEIV